jgi:hypothetical protein
MDCFALKGRHQRVVPPLQGSDFCVNIPQGVALGFQFFASSRLPDTPRYPLKAAKNHFYEFEDTSGRKLAWISGSKAFSISFLLST